MTAALKSPPSPVRPPLSRSRQRAIAEVRQAKYQAAISRLPAPPPPLWLRLLLTLQRSSTGIAFVLVVGVLPLYGWSVYTQRSWGQAFSRLNELQRSERQLVTANEIRKYEVAQQVERSPAGLVPQVPANTLFLQPAPLRPAKPAPAAPATLPPALVSPVGY